MSEITLDNLDLSNPKPGHEKVARYLQHSRAQSTLRAYASDLRAFANWGGVIPSTPDEVARYLAVKADELKPTTLARHLAAISIAHRSISVSSPSDSELVRSVLRGIRRVKGTTQKQARPLLRDALFRCLDSLGGSLRDARDRCILLLGFAGAFRRSELVGFDVDDVEFVEEGVVLHLRRSKTDQEGSGRRIGIPFGRSEHCPVKALHAWLEHAAIESGPLYRPIRKGGRLSATKLSGAAISKIIRGRLLAAGLDAVGYSGHSLRSGLVTSADREAIDLQHVRSQTGHSTDATLCRYIRDKDVFRKNPVRKLL